jgi:AraC-like DNA-binding protein
METGGQSLFLTGQPPIGPYETAPRPVVGFAHDYPAGYATAEHSHPRAQLLYAVSGVMRITVPGAAFLVPPSTALFLPADAPHAIRMDGPVAMRTLFLRADAAARTRAPGPAVLVVSPLLREVVLAACAEPLASAPRGRGRLLAELALDEINRAATLPLRLPMPRDARLRRAIAAMQARPLADMPLEHLAGVAGAAPRTLARLFRAETGLSFRQWRQQARMTEAMAALTMGASAGRAATGAGYASQASFGAAFRAMFGVTPGAARRR